MTQVPQSVLIVGAGPIGLEFATLWNRYGAQVTVIEIMPHVLPLEDQEISIEANKQLKKAGIVVMTDTKVETVQPGRTGVDVTIKHGEARRILSVDNVLVSNGFVPNVEKLEPTLQMNKETTGL